MQQYEYKIVDNGFMMTNRAGPQSITNEQNLGEKLTNEFGKLGWKLVGIIGEDFIFIRPLPEQLEAEAKAVEKVKTKKKLGDSNG